MFVYVAAWMQMARKGRQDVQAASVQLGCLAGWPYNLQQCQLGSLTAWTCNSCSLAAGLLSSVTLRQVQLGSLTAWQRGFTTHQYTISFQRSGSEVWIKSFRKVWIGGLDRVWERGLIQTLHFEPQPIEIID